MITVTGLAIFSAGCLSVPEDTHIFISPNGCTSAGTCPYDKQGPANFYWAPLREIVLAPGQGPRTIAHEYCHAHQHRTVLDELGIEPDNRLLAWHRAAEGRSFSLLASEYPHPWLWISTTDIDIEDFANTCALWLDEPEQLWERSPQRYKWARRWLR